MFSAASESSLSQYSNANNRSLPDVLDYSRGYPMYSPYGVYHPRLAKFCSIMPAISGSASIFGSSCIIYNLLNKKNKLSTVKSRFLFAMCVADIIYSFALAFGPLPSPSGTPGLLEAKGNHVTCSMQGFAFQLGFIIPNYAASLSMTFLLHVRYNVPEKIIRQKIEPWMHAYSILYPFITGIIGASIGIFNTTGPFCWIMPYPHLCHKIPSLECTRGKNAGIFSLIFGVIPFGIALFVSLCSMALIVFSVNQTQKKAHRRQTYTSPNGNHIQFSNSSSKVLKRTYFQASCYVICFVFAYIPSLCSYVMVIFKKPSPPTLTALNIAMLPSFGFWNFLFTFLLARYWQLVKIYPNKSRCWKLWKSISDPNLCLLCVRGQSKIDLLNNRKSKRGDIQNTIISQPHYLRKYAIDSSYGESIDQSQHSPHES